MLYRNWFIIIKLSINSSCNVKPFASANTFASTWISHWLVFTLSTSSSRGKALERLKATPSFKLNTSSNQSPWFVLIELSFLVDSSSSSQPIAHAFIACLATWHLFVQQLLNFYSLQRRLASQIKVSLSFWVFRSKCADAPTNMERVSLTRILCLFRFYTLTERRKA